MGRREAKAMVATAASKVEKALGKPAARATVLTTEGKAPEGRALVAGKAPRVAEKALKLYAVLSPSGMIKHSNRRVFF